MNPWEYSYAQKEQKRNLSQKITTISTLAIQSMVSQWIPVAIVTNLFIISLRGQNELNKFKSDLSCWITENKTSTQYNTHCRDTRIPYDYLLAKRIEFVRQLRAGFDTPKLFHQTQISPGVYSPPTLEEDRDIRSDPTLNNQIS